MPAPVVILLMPTMMAFAIIDRVLDKEKEKVVAKSKKVADTEVAINNCKIPPTEDENAKTGSINNLLCISYK